MSLNWLECLFWNFIFYNCCWAAEILALWCAQLQFLSFADLAVQTKASAALWPLSRSLPSFLILNLKVRKRHCYNTPLRAHLSHFCTVLLWFVNLQSVDPSDSVMDTSCVWWALFIGGTASGSFSKAFPTSSARKVLVNLLQNKKNHVVL